MEERRPADDPVKASQDTSQQHSLKRSRNDPGKSPQEVIIEQSMTSEQESTVATSNDPSAKRLRTNIDAEARTPRASRTSEKTPDMTTDPGDSRLSPLERVHRSTSTDTISSDLSSSSAASRRKSFSPTPYVGEVPPAPPSTPASIGATFSWDVGTATPLPMYPGVYNASTLEQKQQHAMEGAETPAPTRSEAIINKTLIEDFSDWAVGDRYEMMRILGRGSYGEVAQARDLHAKGENAFVAIKRIQSPFDQEVDAIRLYREIHILRRMRGHECIIQLLNVVQPPTDDLDDFHDLYLVFEYVDTDLYKLVMSPQYLTTEHIQTFLYQMLTALKYIHSFSVIHRDLKPANILLNEDCSLKICDFGLARIVDTHTMSSSRRNKVSDDLKPPASFGSPPKVGLTRQLTKHVVTRWYRAPELILIQPYTSAVDIWSLGCILAELLSMQEGNVPGYQDRKPLFPGGTCYPLSGEGENIKKDERLDQLSVIFGVLGTPPKEDIASIGEAKEYIESLEMIQGRSFEKLFPASDNDALDLLRQMLQFNPERRCTADEALDHDFFRTVRRKEMELEAEGPLEGPDFLETQKVDLKTVKEKVYEEVLWYRDNGISPSRTSSIN